MPAHHDEAVYRFCPSCGGTLERRTIKHGDPARLVCARCGFIFYLDPKVAVGTIIRTDDRRIVLVRRAIEPGLGQWVFPGGYVDRGERLDEAARREALEESGLHVRLDGLVNIYSFNGHSPIIVVYAATAIGGELASDEESFEAALFETGDIPWDLLAFRSTKAALRQYLDGILHPVTAFEF
ncbi:MAG: NUDIX hydrolase [Vicinamibacterales bacterium]